MAEIEKKDDLKPDTAMASGANPAAFQRNPGRGPAGRFPTGGFEKRRGGRKSSGREERAKEYDQKILAIRRVARVAAGGRRFNFSVALVLGNRKGSVGVGTGKAADTSLAIDKAARNAKKHMVRIERTKNLSIPHRVEAKFSSARLMILPAPGRGLVAGSALRDVLELGGVHDVVTKILSGSKNKLNIARGAIRALQDLSPRPLPSEAASNISAKQ